MLCPGGTIGPNYRIRFILKDIVLDQAGHTREEVDQGILQSMERSASSRAGRSRPMCLGVPSSESGSPSPP